MVAWQLHTDNETPGSDGSKPKNGTSHLTQCDYTNKIWCLMLFKEVFCVIAELRKFSNFLSSRLQMDLIQVSLRST